MSYVCLWSPGWSTGAAFNAESTLLPLLPALLAHAPRVVIEPSAVGPSCGGGSRLWADARGLHAATLAEQLLDVLRVHGVSDARAGTALTPIGAEVAACWETVMQNAVMRAMAAGDIVVRQTPCITTVRPGCDRALIAEFPVGVLVPSEALINLLDGIGIETCGQLAALSAESVEIRLGPQGLDLWDRARADDPRWLFRTPLRSLPSASFEWSEYALRNAERLLFVINALLASVCAALVEQGERARELSLVFSLANRTQHVHPLRSARPSADQTRWLRLVRDAVEQLQLPDAVTGIAVRVDTVTGNDGAQGDLFDRGFASAGVVETTLAQLADDHGELIVAPLSTRHTMADQRTTWVAAAPDTPAAGERPREQDGGFGLTLQLLPTPRDITVTTAPRRDHEMPIRYRDSEGWHTLVDVAGPDRVSGGQWDGAYAREYFRCVRDDGMLVWMYRGTGDRAASSRGPARWYLHGWWD